MQVCLPNAVGRLTIHVQFQRGVVVALWADGRDVWILFKEVKIDGAIRVE